MIACPSCTAENSDASKFCSECGIALKPEFAATITHGEQGQVSLQSSRSDSSHHGRFLPGTRVDNRYRIVSLAGKGGMGEVYRADDLKLGHTVALKFLPKDLADDPQRLEYFRNEVRLTRQISHPNVCRVYDIGEVDGQHFLSMEYIDGEDLKILLRRIGRLPKDKGVEIAKQLCEGLAAAHDRGVLHRDLKPANIMIDGRGQVRITDFGLAKLADDGAAGEVAGTPAYMAPEQLTRGEATIQSDLYSLGLILYELFTGKAVHDTSSIPELIHAHEESSLSQPSNLVEDMDPAVERVILRCLEKTPSERPKFARLVAAALPGGDALAAAVAAGETPSPEMVAAAGETGAIPLRTGVLCLTALLLGLVALMFLSPLIQPSIDPNAAAPESLRIAAQKEILAPLGYYDANAKPTDAVHGFQLRKRLDGTRDWEFWYRQLSGDYLTPTISEITTGPKSYAVSMSNPSPFGVGMVSVRTDFQGKLVELLAVSDAAFSTKTSIGIKSTFALAGLSFDSYRIEENLPANWRPPIYCDDVAVYRPKSGDSPAWVIAAHEQGRLVYFYAGPVNDGRFLGRQFHYSGDSLNSGDRRVGYNDLKELVVLLVSIFLALRNVRLGRADRIGAMRFAVWLGSMQLLVWLFGVHHVPAPLREWPMLRDFLRVPWLAYFFRHWLYYMALEPYIRRYWPEVLIAWSRAVDGRFRDPLFGQRLLIGCLTGIVVWVICAAVYAVVAELSGITSPLLIEFDVASPLRLKATLIHELSRCASNAVFVLMLLLLLRALLRDTKLAVGGYALANVAVFGLDGFPLLAVAIIGIWSVGLGFAITRFGLIAGMAFLFSQRLLETLPITPHLTAWYAGGTLMALGSIIAVASYGFYTSTLAGRSLFGEGLLDKGNTAQH